MQEKKFEKKKMESLSCSKNQLLSFKFSLLYIITKSILREKELEFIHLIFSLSSERRDPHGAIMHSELD